MIEMRVMHFPEPVQDSSPPFDGEYTVRWTDEAPMLLARYERGRWIFHSNQVDIRWGTPVFYQRLADDLFTGGNR